jgi:hypothetical protein
MAAGLYVWAWPPLATAAADGQGAPQAVPGSAPAVVVPSPPSPPAAASPIDEVEAVVSRYQEAFSARDAQAAKQVWPSVNERSLARAFGQLESQALTFAECQTRMNELATRATVTCRGSLRFVPRIGAGAARVQLRRWDFDVARLAGRWAIVSVDSVEAVPPVARYPESPANSPIRPPR